MINVKRRKIKLPAVGRRIKIQGWESSSCNRLSPGWSGGAHRWEPGSYHGEFLQTDAETLSRDPEEAPRSSVREAWQVLPPFPLEAFSLSRASSNDHQLAGWLLPSSDPQGPSCRLTICDISQGVFISYCCYNK